MKVVIRERDWVRFHFLLEDNKSFGWGNGYVVIPKTSPLHGKHHKDINVNIHGNLTFSELVDNRLVKWFELDKTDIGKWCVGFNTSHPNDKLSDWSKEKVQEEAERLKELLISYEATL